MNRKAKALMVIKNYYRGLEIQRSWCAHARGEQEADVRGWRVSFQELTARSDKVKTSVEYKPRRCKFMCPNFSGNVRLCDPTDKHVRTRKKFKVCVCSLFPTMICFFYSYLVEAVVSILYSLSFSWQLLAT